jgi:hypothetical protein
MKILKHIICYSFLSTTFGISYPEFSVIINNNPYPQDIFLHTTSNQTQFMAILDSDLELKWNIVSTNGKGWDFKVNNNQKITYFRKPSNDWSPSGGGLFYVMNSDMREVDTLSCANNFEADYHDIQFTESGGYLLQAYAKAQVDIPQTEGVDTANVLIIQEFDQDHNIIMEWKNFEHMDIQNYLGELSLQSTYRNWMHGNSMEIDNDSNIIISNRAMSELIKFDRQSGEVIWRLGGPMNDFTFIDDPLFGPNRQHDARRLNNGNIMIFDNGDQREVPHTRVSEYQINENDLTATLVWQYTHPEEYVSLNQGCAQRLDNGNTLISWGGVSGHGQIITEIDTSNQRVLEIEYPQGSYSYKVRKSDWSFDIDLVRGDINLDENTDILDIVATVNYILSEHEPDLFYLYKLDLDYSGGIDISDVTMLLDILI